MFFLLYLLLILQYQTPSSSLATTAVALFHIGTKPNEQTYCL